LCSPQTRLLNFYSRPNADGDYLDGALRTGITIHSLVFAMERTGRIRRLPWNIQFVALARIADIGGAGQCGAA